MDQGSGNGALVGPIGRGKRTARGWLVEEQTTMLIYITSCISLDWCLIHMYEKTIRLT